MIGEFLDSFELLRTTYLSGVLVAVTLAAVGVWVVARDQILLGAAVSQASTLGVAIALAVGSAVGGGSHDTGHLLHFFETDGALAGMAVLAAVATALLASGREQDRGASGEAVTGWVFLLSASLPVLLVAHQPHGLETIQRLVFSTLLSATETDLAAFSALAALTALILYRLHDRLILLAMDPETAGAFGISRRRWHAGVAIWLGLTVGLAIRTSGAVFTFGCLVLPALLARGLCRETRPVLWVAPLAAGTAALLGFLVAHGRDWPPAHTIVFLLCVGVGLSYCVRGLRSR